MTKAHEISLTDKLDDIRKDILDEYQQPHAFPWIIGFSGGKDSTFLAQLVIEVLLEIAPSDRRREIHLVANDTRVESPPLIDHIDNMLSKLQNAAENLRIPLKTIKTKPPLEQTFWVNLIGRGYPSPNHSFRWCTDRLKIQPTSQYIKSKITENGETILLLGVRSEESATRARSINRFSRQHRLNPHNTLNGCHVFRPIINLTTEEVWQCLYEMRPPWGGNHNELIELYKNAQSGESPFVSDKSEEPASNSQSLRLGCWTCTVVVKDKSINGFIDSGIKGLEPLMRFRDWIAQIRNDTTKRMATRRGGKINYLPNGSLIPGPFTLEARKEILDRLLETQKKVGKELISLDEVDLIKQIWAEDSAKHVKDHIKKAKG